MRIDTETADSPPGDAGELAGTRRSRLLASVLIIVTLLAVGASTMPDTVLKARALDVARPFLGVTGLDQAWGVFAPDPRTETSEVLTLIERADGSSVTLPHPGSKGIAEYSDYRWRTLASQLGGRQREAARVAYARWIAAQDRAEGQVPVRVTLLRRVASLEPPGPGPDRGPWRETTLLSLDVAR